MDFQVQEEGIDEAFEEEMLSDVTDYGEAVNQGYEGDNSGQGQDEDIQVCQGFVAF